MNKRILSILLCLMLVMSLLVLAVPVNAAPASSQLIITADKTEAKPGDTIEFTVSVGPITEFGMLQADLVISEGLTYVSGDLIPGTKEKLGFTDLNYDITEGGAVKRITGNTPLGDYASDTATPILTFTCTVDDDATGTLSVNLKGITVGSGETFEEFDTTVVPAEVTVVTETPTEAPATEAPVTEAPATEAPVTEAPVTEAPATEAPTEKPAPELEYVPQVDPTATEAGVKAHYVDPATGKKYADATGTVEVTDADLYIAPLGQPTEAATDAPATEAPATEAPATEAPATEAPATEAPATEAPATEAPATEAPATEAPATEAPATEAPATEADEPATEAIVETEAATVAATTAATKDSSTKDSSTKTTSTATSSTPKTGDSTHMYLWMLIMLASLAGAIAVLYTAKRKGIFTK